MDECEIQILMSEDKTEMDLKLKSSKPLTTDQVIMELESLIHDLSRAEEQRKQPGVATH